MSESERHVETREEYIDMCFEDFAVSLFLDRPMGSDDMYDYLQIARTGADYLRVIEVEPMHCNTYRSSAEDFLRLQYAGRIDKDHPRRIPTLILGIIVGEALFSPFSTLHDDKKGELLARTMDAVDRIHLEESRGDPVDFTNILQEYARVYNAQNRTPELEERVLDLHAQTRENASRASQ